MTDSAKKELLTKIRDKVWESRTEIGALALILELMRDEEHEYEGLIARVRTTATEIGALAGMISIMENEYES